MPRDHRPSPPPPLPARRAPLAIAWRAALWRARFVVVALCLGVAAASTLDALRPAPPVTVPVVVASHDVDAGTPLTAADVEVRRLPSDLAPDRSFRRTSDVVGSPTAVPIGAGLPVAPGLLVGDDVHGPPGTVVTAVRFADPAVAGLLRPGMRVDVVAATPEGTVDGTVAVRALVLPLPAAGPDPGGGAGLLGGSTGSAVEQPPVLLAVSSDEATALAGAAASALLSPVVVP
jgi:Flp pilus assembly protein CpaB